MINIISVRHLNPEFAPHVTYVGCKSGLWEASPLGNPPAIRRKYTRPGDSIPEFNAVSEGRLF